jgi:type IV secretory pathway component VirB8
VLKSKRAIQVNVAIMRAFVRLRVILASNRELARKLESLEQRYDKQFKVVFEFIRRLTAAKGRPKNPIGFVATPRRREDSAVKTKM